MLVAVVEDGKIYRLNIPEFPGLDNADRYIALTDNGRWEEFETGGGGSGNPFVFQVNAIDDPLHYHIVQLSIEQVRFLVENLDATVTTLSELRDGHQHEITFDYDHATADFIVTSIVRVGDNVGGGDQNGTHEVKLIGKGAGSSLTADQEAALAGTSGTPSGTNKFVTDSDPRVDVPVRRATGTNSFVLGDTSNSVSGDRSGIVSGNNNLIGGGSQPNNSAIVAGDNNKVRSYATAIIAGGTNEAPEGSHFSAIVAGTNNKVFGQRAAVIGGDRIVGYGLRSVAIGGFNYTTPNLSDMVFLPQAYLMQNGGGISMVSTNGTRKVVALNDAGKLTVDGVEVGGNATVTEINLDGELEDGTPIHGQVALVNGALQLSYSHEDGSGSNLRIEHDQVTVNGQPLGSGGVTTSVIDGLGVVAVGVFYSALLGAGAFNQVPVVTSSVDMKPAGTTGGWNLTTGKYVVPVSGTYQMTMKARLGDGHGSPGNSYGIGAGVQNIDDSAFFWTAIPTVNGANRKGVLNQRTMYLTAGQEVQVYLLLDGFQAEVNGELVVTLVRPDTPLNEEKNLEFVFASGYADDFTATIGTRQAGTYYTVTLSNGTAVYQKNGVAANLPITLAAGDTLKVTVTRTDSALGSVVTLKG
ncbi:hypothetical protein ASU33_13745 [Solirubrum puertoriconensis]|uniref:Uncharacterized protein n=2 Tax=Solirubrum puertoriconensis TaxID=1751427 RepID=A0A9X0HK17_SOLP1|nr:hypothetical protein ASU33_13745 [Solirubrum puertoriconensis]